jgi:superfamily II DNA or RNA helicase
LLALAADHENPAETPDLVLQSEEATLDLSRPLVASGLLSGDLTLRLDAQIHIPRSVPTPVLAALKRLATFANPVFHEKLRLRFPTFDTPRFLFAGEWHPDRLVLPRGVLEPCLQIIEEAGAEARVQDQRDKGARRAWTFNGVLRPEQQTAVREMEQHDIGVLCAPPGSGKTVMGCALIARHRTSALVLVHRAVLLDQWKETAMTFLGLKKKEIGLWKGAKPQLTHWLDLAMLPSLSRTADYAAAFAGYGIIIVDECHHVPATTFELLLKACPARRIIGLTATPQRKDRLEKLMHFQCGPIRHTLEPVESEEQERCVFVRRSTITLPPSPTEIPIHEIWAALVSDEARLKRVVEDIKICAEDGRSPLILADRKIYLDKLESALAQAGTLSSIPRYRLESGVGKKARNEIRQRIDAHYLAKAPFILLATASLIGEGFDLPQLDTLVLAMPLSFKGRLIQYAGRLHRNHEGKAAARIYDYLDENCPLTRAMFQRRSAGYRQMGYKIEIEETLIAPSLIPAG